MNASVTLNVNTLGFIGEAGDWEAGDLEISASFHSPHDELNWKDAVHEIMRPMELLCGRKTSNAAEALIAAMDVVLPDGSVVPDITIYGQEGVRGAFPDDMPDQLLSTQRDRYLEARSVFLEACRADLGTVTDGHGRDLPNFRRHDAASSEFRQT